MEYMFFIKSRKPKMIFTLLHKINKWNIFLWENKKEKKEKEKEKEKEKGKKEKKKITLVLAKFFTSY